MIAPIPPRPSSAVEAAREHLVRRLLVAEHLRTALARDAERRGVTDSTPEFPIGEVGRG